MATRRLKRPRDPIQLGKLIVEAFADNQMLFLESLVRTRLPAGGGRIRTLGPALSAYRLGTASCRLRDPSPRRRRQNGITLSRSGDRGFESCSLQRRVCELSVPLLSRPEGDVRGIGFQTVRTYIAIGNSEARGAMLARTIFGVAENSQAYRGPRARHPPRIEAF